MRILHAWGFPASLNSRKSVKFSNDDAHIIEHIIFPPFWFNVVQSTREEKALACSKSSSYIQISFFFFFLIKERRINRIVILLLFYHRLNTNVKYRNEDLLILLIKTRFTSRLRVFKKRETMHKHRLINLYHREIPAFPILSDSTLFLFQYNSNFCKLENPRPILILPFFFPFLPFHEHAIKWSKFVPRSNFLSVTGDNDRWRAVNRSDIDS